MDKQRKILTMIMLLIVAAPLLLYAVYLVKQKLIQHQMLERLESSSLKTIAINSTDFKWEKVNREIVIEGELFDVKSFIANGDQIFVTGLFDSAEKELQDQFANILHQKKNSPAPLDTLLLKFMFTVAIVQHVHSINAIDNFTELVYHPFKQLLLSNAMAVTTPPPNV